MHAKILTPLGLAAMLTLAYVPLSRDWFIDQAQRHVVHQLQPVIDDLSEPPASPTTHAASYRAVGAGAVSVFLAACDHARCNGVGKGQAPATRGDSLDHLVQG